MIREIVENIESQEEFLGFSKEEKAWTKEIADGVRSQEKSLTDSSAIHDFLAKLSRAGNKTANSLLHDVMSGQKYKDAFIKKWIKKAVH